MIEYSIKKINDIGNQSKVLLFIVLKELQEGGHLIECYTYWAGKGVQSMCVIGNLGRNKLNETYLATSGLAGNNWTCFLVEFSSTDIFYCDSVAWFRGLAVFGSFRESLCPRNF